MGRAFIAYLFGAAVGMGIVLLVILVTRLEKPGAYARGYAAAVDSVRAVSGPATVGKWLLDELDAEKRRYTIIVYGTSGDTLYQMHANFVQESGYAATGE